MPLRVASESGLDESVENIGILAVASALPRARWSAETIAARLRVDPAVIRDQLDLHEKPVALDEDEHPSDFATRATEAALRACGANATDVGLVIFTGVSRDYLGSWSVALEVIGRVGLVNAIGYDLNLGCAASVVAIEHARTRSRDGAPLSVVVSAERWAHTISGEVPIPLAFAAHADGGAACVLGPGARHVVGPTSMIVQPAFNSFVSIPAGGTREPASAETVAQHRHLRTVASTDGRNVDRYVEGYRHVTTRALELAGPARPIELLLTNQLRPAMRERIHRLFDVREDQSINTYPRLGHMGGADLFVGLEHAVREGRVKRGRSLLAASANNAFGALTLEGDTDGGIAIPS